MAITVCLSVPHRVDNSRQFRYRSRSKHGHPDCGGTVGRQPRQSKAVCKTEEYHKPDESASSANPRGNVLSSPIHNKASNSYSPQQKQSDRPLILASDPLEKLEVTARSECVPVVHEDEAQKHCLKPRQPLHKSLLRSVNYAKNNSATSWNGHCHFSAFFGAHNVSRPGTPIEIAYRIR